MTDWGLDAQCLTQRHLSLNDLSPIRYKAEIQVSQWFSTNTLKLSFKLFLRKNFLDGSNYYMTVNMKEIMVQFHPCSRNTRIIFESNT